MKNKFLLWIIIPFLISSYVSAQPLFDNDMDCFTILAGKKATSDGSVMLAHNEDGPGYTLVNWYRVDPVDLKSPNPITTNTGVTIPFPAHTTGLLWLEMPGLSFSDSYMNDYGVVITSNGCHSREDNPSLAGGGIGYWLRRMMALQARTAREAVTIGGKLIEQYGYYSSGRTYSIADSSEAWMMAVVKGRHWVACRIPDDRVAVIPNYYTIQEVDLSDTLNFLGSADLIEYAAKRDWYDLSAGKPFNFRLAYADTASLQSVNNIARHWQGINQLSDQSFALTDRFPFHFKPENPVLLSQLFSVLQDHYEGSSLHPGLMPKTDPHDSDTMRICSDRNQYGFVAQLRKNQPVEIGAVLWLAPPHPCMQPYIPWYCGIRSVPEVYSDSTDLYAIEHHFEQHRKMKSPCDHAYCIFLDHARKVNADYPSVIDGIEEYKNIRQKEIFQLQKEEEAIFLKDYLKDRQQALKRITAFSGRLAVEEYEKTRQQLKKYEIE